MVVKNKLNDLSTLTSRILADANEHASAVIKSAEADAAQVMDAAGKDADKAAQGILAAAQHQCEAIAERAESQSGIEQRNMQLSARRSAIDAAFSLAMEKLQSYPQDKMTAFLSSIAEKQMSDNAELIFNAKDRELGQKVCENLNALGKKAVLSDTQGNFAGGFIIKEGSIETNCTFEVLIKGVAEEVETEVASILFS